VDGERHAFFVVEQAIVRIGQDGVGLEPGGLSARQNGGESGVLRHHKASSQGFVRQTGSGYQSQRVRVQAEQAHRVAFKMFTKGVNGTLQANRIG
jgi:hypothetical protein